GTLVFGQVLHLPGDHGLQRQLLLLGGELAPIGPFADFHGQFQAGVDLRGDVFDHLRKSGHSVSKNQADSLRRASAPPKSPLRQPTNSPPTWAALAIAPKPSRVISPDRHSSSHTSIITSTPRGMRYTGFGASH